MGKLFQTSLAVLRDMTDRFTTALENLQDKIDKLEDKENTTDLDDQMLADYNDLRTALEDAQSGIDQAIDSLETI